jgi:creatinine amidohydrolase
LGCTEQQGPHLTVDFDTQMITQLCDDIARRLDGAHSVIALVMPTLPFGPTPEHIGFGHGYVNLRQSTHEAIVEDLLESLAAQGFKRLFLWRGCGQHELGNVVERFNASQDECRAYQPVVDYGHISMSVLGDVPGGHADSFGTSICMLLNESGLRSELIRKPRNKPFAWSDTMNFAAISDTGVIGDPTKASKAAGAALWERCVEAGTQAVLTILRGEPISETWHF